MVAEESKKLTKMLRDLGNAIENCSKVSERKDMSIL